MKHVAWLAMILLLAGCSKHIPVDGRDVRADINTRAERNRATVVLVDGTRLRDQTVNVSPNGLVTQGRQSNSPQTIPLEDLQYLEFYSPLEGMGIGFLAGTGLGVFIASAGSVGASHGSVTGGLDRIFAVVLCSMGGALNGLLAGNSIRYDFNYGLEPPPDCWPAGSPVQWPPTDGRNHGPALGGNRPLNRRR